MAEIEEVSYPVEALEIGMYVCRLDRPWIETPFPMAGFTISSQQEIDQLRQYCRQVYVDVELGICPDLSLQSLGGLPLITVEEPELTPVTGAKIESRDEQQQKYAAMRRFDYTQQTSLQQELGSARRAYDGLQDETVRILSALEAGHKLEYEGLRAHVQETVESIIRNPSALMLLVQLEKSDRYTYNHALGTSVWCAEFGRHLGLGLADINNLALGGMLLDVGKTRLPKDLFVKQDFDEEDRRLIRTHVECSLNILVETDGIDSAILDMVETHHERFDGTGYPRRLHGDQISLFGRIAGLVDSYDAMTTRRPYTDKVLSPHQAISQIYNWRDSLFEGELVEQFIQTVGIYPAGSLVELNTGQVGVVISINNQRKLCPSVLLMLDGDKQPYPVPKHLNLAESPDGMRVAKGLSPGAYGISFEELQLDAVRSF